MCGHCFVWNILPTHLATIVGRKRELRNSSSRVYLIQRKELESDEKVANDESCHVYLLRIPFHSGASGVQAPNDTNGEMKEANLTVLGTELWCLTDHRLPRSNTEEDKC